MVKGKDITDYQNIKNSVDYFFDIPEKNPKYIFNMDKNGYGLMQVSTRRLGSRKLFSWGNSDGSNRWQEFLTEEAGRYLEIQAGLARISVRLYSYGSSYCLGVDRTVWRCAAF